MPIVADTALPIETDEDGNRGVAVYPQDQISPSLDLWFLQRLGTFTLTANTSIDSRVFQASPGHSIVVGNIVELSSTLTGEFIQTEVTGVSVNAITLDSPIGRVFEVADTEGIVSNKDFGSVDGSVTPVVFAVKPQISQKGQMTRIIITATSSGAMDLSKFADLTALSNGVVLRKKLQDGSYRNQFNFKTNGDFVSRSFDKDFPDKVGGGLNGFTARSTWAGKSRRGVVVQLDGAKGEEWQMLVQDDLRAITGEYLSVAQGSETQD